MDATYRALRTRGFAGLTMKTIADEAGKSKSLLHYHYDTKDELLVSFLAYMLDRFHEQVSSMGGDTATERLNLLIDRLSPDTGESDRDAFHRALLEMSAQAPCHDAYRQRIRQNRESIRAIFTEVIRDGIESGEFREVDPEQTARFVLSAIDGGRNAYVALGDEEEPNAVRAGLAEFVVADLRRENEVADE